MHVIPSQSRFTARSTARVKRHAAAAKAARREAAKSLWTVQLHAARHSGTLRRWRPSCPGFDGLSSTVHDIEDDIVIASLVWTVINRKKMCGKERRRWQVHPPLRVREKRRSFQTLVKKLALFDEKFHDYFRSHSREPFAQVLFLGQDGCIEKRHSIHVVISAKERLCNV